jgi:2-polyprenyl-3-methyl-5-hydroxy-6-metoxy-1,4-benzoquinol methylase
MFMKIRLKILEQEYRKQLLSHAQGSILEIGAGAGVNFKYYPPGSDVTATDISTRIIERAKAEAMETNLRARFIISPVEELQFENESFDTIVSTFTLCAYEKPEAVLGQIGSWCKSSGSILLMEYGLSQNGLVSWVQKKVAPVHYKKTGYRIDRDMIKLVSASGLRIKKMEIKYAGIVYLVWATLCRESK